MKLKCLFAGIACALAAFSAISAEAPTTESVLACHARAKNDDQRGACLELEWKLVQAEHKEVSDRVNAVARSWDRQAKTRQRTEKFVRVGQSFESFVNRECDFVRFTTRGSRQKEENAELACKISYFRMHADVLENRYLNSTVR